MTRTPRYDFPDQAIQTIVGNGRLIARVWPDRILFAYGAPLGSLALGLDGRPLGSQGVSTAVVPRATKHDLPGGARVTHAAHPREMLHVAVVEAASPGAWSLQYEPAAKPVADAVRDAAELGGAAPDPAPGAHALAIGGWTVCAVGAGAERVGDTLTVRLDAPGVFVWMAGEADAVEAFKAGLGGDAAAALDAIGGWTDGVLTTGLRLQTPVPELDAAVEFMKAHMHLGYDWTPGDAKMVCDVFRWRDVWSRDFGSGFGPGAIAAHLYDGVLDTLEYEMARHRAHPPAGLKVSDDTSQGGSAEGLGWLMKLVWRVHKHTGDRETLARHVAAFEPWIEEWTARDADADGLICDVTEWMDHSRFLRLPEGQRTLYSNALYYAALRRMSYALDVLGRPEDSDRYRALADRSRVAIHDAFWNDAGYFNNAVQWGRPDTALMLADVAIAIVERIASRNERFRTLETLKERSWREYGTVTCDVPMRYVPAENDHNVKVWPWWMAHEAKARFFNYDAEGGLHVLSKITDTLRRPTLPGLCEEYLNPDDGTQDDVVGHAFITGAGATLDAVLYGLVGLSIREPGERRIRLAPVVPRAWTEWSADIDLFKGSVRFEQTPDSYYIVLEAARTEVLEVRVPPREAVEFVSVNGVEVEPEREEDGASLTLRFSLVPGERQTVTIGFAEQRVWDGVMVMPPALPEPVEVARPVLMDEPRLFADILQGFVRSAVSYFGTMHHAAAREIGELDGPGDLLVVVGNEMPWRTKRGASVPDMLDAYLARGGSMLLLGPRFRPIDPTASYHGGAQMGQHAGMFWWKDWADGHWQDVDPQTGTLLDAPSQDGTVYWGDGPLFPDWEHSVGLFGFEAPCRGVFDSQGNAVDPEQSVEIVYTDWAVRRPWQFHPLAFTERADGLLTGPHASLYPCAALLENEETGARIVVVSPTLCSRTDLLHQMLGHVVPKG